MSAQASVLHSDDAVLIVVDVQERLAAAMDRRRSVLDACDKLVRTAALTGVPVLATRQYPSGLGDLEPALAERLAALADEGASVLGADKVAFDCFAEPTFVEALAATGRHQLVIAGMETHICVTQTALAALAAGFDVHVVADACCSRDAENHERALARLSAAGAVVTVTESVLYELVGEAGTEEFRSLLRIVKGQD